MLYGKRLLLVAIVAICVLRNTQIAGTSRAKIKESSSSTSHSKKSGNLDKIGNKHTSSSRSSRVTSRRSHDNDYDEYEDENGLYDESENVRSRGKRSGYGKGALVPVRRVVKGRGRQPPKPSLLAGIASSMISKAAVMQQVSRGKAMEWRKIVKGKVSSQFEKFMLQLTWPDDSPVDAVYTADMMHYLDTADDYPDEMAPTNPYRRTLRKLWARMSEKDHRTVLKSLMLIHHMAVDLGPDASARIRKHILRMRKELNTKKQSETYFQLARIVEVSAVGEPFIPFIKAYASYAFKRVTAFQGGSKAALRTLKGKKTSEESAVNLLKTLDFLIMQGVNVKVDRKEQLTDLTKSALQLTATDLCDLWRLYSNGMERLINSEFAVVKGSNEAKLECVERYADVQKALYGHLQLCRKMKLIRDLSKFEDNQINEESLADAIKSSETSPKTSKPPVSFKTSIKSASTVTDTEKRTIETSVDSDDDYDNEDEVEEEDYDAEVEKSEEDSDVDDESDKDESDQYEDEYEYSEDE